MTHKKEDKNKVHDDKAPKEQKNEEIEKREQQIGELTDLLQRLQAEFENYRKRVENEKSAFMQCASRDLLLKFLTVLDNFELALKHTNNHDELVKGIDLIYAQFMQIMKEEGVGHIEVLNAKFDPALHEVLIADKSDKEQGTILEELQKGYTLNGSVLRHAKVKVSK